MTVAIDTNIDVDYYVTFIAWLSKEIPTVL